MNENKLSSRARYVLEAVEPTCEGDDAWPSSFGVRVAMQFHWQQVAFRMWTPTCAATPATSREGIIIQTDGDGKPLSHKHLLQLLTDRHVLQAVGAWLVRIVCKNQVKHDCDG